MAATVPRVAKKRPRALPAPVPGRPGPRKRMDPNWWKLDPRLNPWPFTPGWMGMTRYPEQLWGVPPNPDDQPVNFGFNREKTPGWGAAGYGWGETPVKPKGFPHGYYGMPADPMTNPWRPRPLPYQQPPYPPSYPPFSLTRT